MKIYELPRVTYHRAYSELRRLFGNRLRRERLRLGMTQVQLCAQMARILKPGLGRPLSARSYVDLENGVRLCSPASRYARLFKNEWGDQVLWALIKIGEQLRTAHRVAHNCKRRWRPWTTASSGAAFLRIQAGYTQRELAEKVGVAHQQIYALEHGRNRPPKLMKDLCDFYGTDHRIFHPDMFLEERHQNDQRLLLGQLSAEEVHTEQIWAEEQRSPTPEELVGDKEELMLLQGLGKELSFREQRVLWAQFYQDMGPTEIMNSLFPCREYRTPKNSRRIYGRTLRICTDALGRLRAGLISRHMDWVRVRQ